MKMLLGAAALASLGSVNAGTFDFNQNEILFIKQMSDTFRADKSKLGFFNGVKVLGDQTFAFMEGVLRFDLEFKNIDINDANLASFGAKNDDVLNAYFGAVFFDTDNNAGKSLSDAIDDDIVANNGNNQALFDTQDGQIANVAAIGVTTLQLAKAPREFCLDDTQCVGKRDDQGFGDTVVRHCNGLNDANAVPSCDDFVSFFTLRWLMTWIGITYGILLLWVLYWTYPIMKRKLFGKKGPAAGGAAKAGPYSEQDQILINTLAVQCASAENLLFQATDLVQKARGMENIMAVEAKRESKIMVYACQYLQAVCSIMVALTHQYLDRKTNTPGEKYNMEDCTTRALQLEVLNYVRDRFQLAFNADMMTEKSLFRIAEGYAVLKKITDSLVFVGFDIDRKFKDSLGDLRTPFVSFSEDAIFLGGVFKPATPMYGTETLVNQPVCLTIDNADKRNLQPISPSLYLANQQKDSKIYDPKMEQVTRGTGKCLTYNTLNGGQVGEGLQFFVRTFWGNEIAAIQSEAQRWLQVDGAMEQYLDNERMEREQRAGPVLKKSHARKRDKKDKKGKRRKHKNKDGYSETDETATEMSGYTETSGWSVENDNNYVYNVHAVVNQGLGIAGKPGIPYDKPGETPVKKGSKLYQWFEAHFPNYAEWPKFYTFVFVLMPLAIGIPMLAKIGKGAGAIDINGNVAFKARAAGFGISFLGVPAYYFLDGFVPQAADLVGINDASIANGRTNVNTILDQLENKEPFGGQNNQVFISNAQSFDMFVNDFDGASGRIPDGFIGDIQAGILVQPDVAALDGIRNQQLAQEVTTTILYALMHNAAYFFGLIPLTLIRESLEILARKWPFIREVYPMSLWRELHMSMGLAGIFYVVFGATVFLVTALVGIGKSTPFGGLAGDPNIASFFDLEANVLYLRQLLLPAVPLLLLMKYAARGPPSLMRKYAPTIITKNYWEICYFLHYFTSLTAIIMLVLYRPQVFYWMGATWGFVWGGNKIVRILRTRKTTIKRSNLVSYTVEDKRNNAKKRSDVLRIELNVPSSFPSSARGQACWLTVPAVDYVAHPFTLAKVPDNEKTIMFHIAVRYLEGDDVISYARPDAEPVKEVAIQTTPVGDPNALPPGWKSAVDPNSGQTYYYNTLEKRTTWRKPVANGLDKMFDGVRGITTRMSANFLRGGSSRFGGVGGLSSTALGADNTKQFAASSRATWTQKFAQLAYKLSTMEPDLRRNMVKNYPVYVSAPLGTSMDDCLKPSLPGSIIITTQNGLPAAESSVRWLLRQNKTYRPKFHFFVSVSREVNDALSVVETLRDAMCESVVAGHLDIDGVNGRHAHMIDWLGVYIHLTRRKPATIEGDRDMLMRSLNPPAAPVTERQLELINAYIRNRVMPGRLPFDRFLARTQQMVRKRCGADNLAVGYCGSAKVAYSIRSSCRALERVKFDGEFI